MWALLDREPSLSASELARKAYGSFATAWQVKHDRALIGGGQLRPGRPLAQIDGVMTALDPEDSAI
jgi:hypothetical protein